MAGDVNDAGPKVVISQRAVLSVVLQVPGMLP